MTYGIFRMYPTINVSDHPMTHHLHIVAFDPTADDGELDFSLPLDRPAGMSHTTFLFGDRYGGGQP